MNILIFPALDIFSGGTSHWRNDDHRVSWLNSWSQLFRSQDLKVASLSASLRTTHMSRLLRKCDFLILLTKKALLLKPVNKIDFKGWHSDFSPVPREQVLFSLSFFFTDNHLTLPIEVSVPVTSFGHVRNGVENRLHSFYLLLITSPTNAPLSPISTYKSIGFHVSAWDPWFKSLIYFYSCPQCQCGRVQTCFHIHWDVREIKEETDFSYQSVKD